MSIIRQIDFLTVDEYLAREQQSTIKHEFVAGLIYAMVGGKNSHNLIATNALGSFFSRLKGNPCRAFNSDTKIRVRMSSGTRFYYPDASVICHPNPPSALFQDQPSVIVEVLSESTRRIDDGEKREAYLTIPSLTHYILLEQSMIAAIVYQRNVSGFDRLVVTGQHDAIEIPELNISLLLSDSYDGSEIDN